VAGSGEPLKVLLVGAESAAIQVLNGLAGSGHTVVGVLADEPTVSVGEGLSGAAGRLGIETIEASNVKDPAFAGWIVEREVDLLLNVHSLSIAADAVVGAPRIGSFNLHPGPLPGYAGLNVFCWAIYNGESRHAVTLHWMDAGLDTGLIAYEEWFPIADRDTGLSVFSKCVRAGVPLVFRLLEQAATDPSGIPRRRQVGERRLYLRRDVPHGGPIEWSQPARRLRDLVRACDFGPFPSPWERPVAMLGEVPTTITAAALTGERCASPPGTIGGVDDDGVRVATADEWLIVRGTTGDGRPVPPIDSLESGRRVAAPA
jgi:UDP-4-amino-4-deoxy-L-arabinose formyltransferase/UDP-glucuronic acid dehydrogenase (UDP-4-keto-hexauronic acid decarboxylating)